jgi:hypothetical protein
MSIKKAEVRSPKVRRSRRRSGGDRKGSPEVRGSRAEVVQQSGGNVNGSPEVAVSPRIGFRCEATPRDIGNPRGRNGVEGSGGPEGSGDLSGGWSVMT